MRRLQLLLLALCLPCVYSYAQSFSDMQAEYDAFVNQTRKEYDDFRNQANAEYADFIRKSWEEFNMETAMPMPTKPEPVKQPVYIPEPEPQPEPEPTTPREDLEKLDTPKPNPIATPEPKPLPYDEIVKVVPPAAQPEPYEPIPEVVVPPTAPSITFKLYGATCTVHLDKNSPLILANNKEESVAKAWETLSNEQYNVVLNECLDLRESLQLCDWGYLQLCKKLTQAQFGSDASNEAIVIQAYILTQSGYKIRMARIGEKLTLLLPSKETVYGLSYITMEDDKYYLIDKAMAGQSIQLCNGSFPGEKYLSLYVNRQPKLPLELSTKQSKGVKVFSQSTLPLSVNRNLIDFYASFPQCKWDIHATASLSNEAKADLYPTLKNAIAGKSEAEAANILINFVQTGFSYKTDDEQFGYERPLFADETLFYPYSDCEDRAVLYSILIRELLGLDVALVNYPNHLATAVRFKGDVKGDYILINGAKYLVCDPTYINANIGLTMPDMDNQVAKIIVL